MGGGGGRGGGWRVGGGEAFNAPEDNFVRVSAFGEDEVVIPCYTVGMLEWGGIESFGKGWMVPINVVCVNSTC